MKILSKYIKPGTKRVRTHFLWLPRSTRDEIRWLEKATFEEVYQPSETDTWITVRFID